MKQTAKIYGLIFIGVLALLVVLALSKKQVTDWRKNFDTEEKSPFGLYVFDHEADSLLNGTLKRTELSPYSYYKGGEKPHNILMIRQEQDDASWKKVLAQVSEGSDALLFMEEWPQILQDTLKFISVPAYFERSAEKLTDTKLQDGIFIDKFPTKRYFSSMPRDGEILGYRQVEDGRQADFIRLNFGKGHFYLHAEPLVATNYYLLKSNRPAYTADVFSYLPNRDTVWFTDKKEADSSSPVSFILSRPALRYAWWLFLAGLLLFVVFNAKRRQRVVPIVLPPENKSAEFVRSVSNLYLQEGDYRDMMLKKAQYFMHRVRTDLMIDSVPTDEDFPLRLSIKTGQPQEKISQALALIAKAQNPEKILQMQDLETLNRLLDEILSS